MSRGSEPDRLQGLSDAERAIALQQTEKRADAAATLAQAAEERTSERRRPRNGGAAAAKHQAKEKVMAKARKRPGNTPVEQQQRPAGEVHRTRPVRRAITGPGAADFLTAPGGFDVPESGTKGMAQTRDAGFVSDQRKRLAPRLGPDTEAPPRERNPEESMRGSETGTIGGGGLEAHNPSPLRATEEKQSKVRKKSKSRQR